ncbi:MAG: aldehyde dehydrogenase family protein [Bacteroidota bacterium]
MADFTELIRKQHYLNGKWIDGHNESRLTVANKYTKDELATLTLASPAQVSQAIDAAHRAQGAFRKFSAQQKAERLEALADKLRNQREAFAQLICAEAGKPIAYARTEVERALTTLKFAAAECLRDGGEYVNVDYNAGEGRTALVRRFPIGPVAGITPFNFPLNLVMHKVAPALAVGAPIIIKPASKTPLTALALASLIDELDYPEGAFNVIAARGSHTESLVTDERVKHLSFTGSDTVGWGLKGQAQKKHVTLELGGNAAVIVDAGIDVNKAAEATAYGSFLYAGQICISTQRVIVHKAVYDEFEVAFLDATARTHTGDPTDERTVNGPMISDDDLQRIDSWVNEARESKAEILMGGEVRSETHNLYAPTIIRDFRSDLKVAEEEAFAPVVVIERVNDFEEALERANDSRYGLQAGVFTNSVAHMKRAHEALEVGGVIINSVPGFRVDSMPYGGVKDSGHGREGVKYAMESMTEPRLLVY